MLACIVAIVLIVSSIDILHGAQKFQHPDPHETGKCTDNIEDKYSKRLLNCGFCQIDEDYESRTPEMEAEAGERCRLACQLLKNLNRGSCFRVAYRNETTDFCTCARNIFANRHKLKISYDD
ncbi:hypothetical protein HDE_08369 [Halotydeus destructor]|nr:hypothetical protein HDE_08369 [Halotydeus destructor]